MKPYLFGELLVLIIGVWLMVVAFLVYGWLLLKRQKQMFAQILTHLEGKTETPQSEETEQKEPEETQSQKNEEEEPVHMEISRDEPISKYENFVPGENVDISFVDKKE